MTSSNYEMTSCTLSLIQLFSIAIIQQSNPTEISIFEKWIYSQFIINFAYSFEVIFDFMAYGKKVLKRSWRTLPEILCQLFNLATVYRFFILDNNSIDVYIVDRRIHLNLKYLHLIVFIRALKLLLFIYEIKEM